MERIAMKLKESRRFRCGVTSFHCRQGKLVYLMQRSKTTGKVLLDFGSRRVDWFHESILDCFEYDKPDNNPDDDSKLKQEQYDDLVSDIQICISQIGSIYPTFGRACYDEPVNRLAHMIATMVRDEYGDTFSGQAESGESDGD